MHADRRFAFLVPGDWHAPTGGHAYGRRMALALQAAGWTMDLRRIDGRWPWPDVAMLAAAKAAVESLPDGTRVLADGLAYGALPELARRHARRLRWVALVHHPLHLESGLDPAARARLRSGEADALASARRVVVTSRSTAGDVAAMGVAAGLIRVVEPGTDRVARPHDGGDRVAGPLRLLCVGSLTPRKGHAVLLQALEGLADRDWVLHGVGSPAQDPDTAARLLAMSRSPALAGRIVWHGAVDAGGMPAHYAAADLFVLPSLHEGYGMAAAEALAHGLPVLASSAGALAFTVPPAAGLQVPPGDVAALRSALARLIGDPDLRAALAAGARAAARRLPRWPRQAARLARVLSEVA